MATRMKVKELKALDSNSIRSRISMQRADSAYLESHYEGLLRKHLNRWVIISEGKFVKSERDPERLFETLSKSKRKGMLVYYIADPKEIMLL